MINDKQLIIQILQLQRREREKSENRSVNVHMPGEVGSSVSRCLASNTSEQGSVQVQ